MKKHIFWIGVGILAGAVLIGAIVFYRIILKPSFYGSVIGSPIQAPDFTLTDQKNESVSLSELKGKYVLMFFGFTNCDDECPATMAILAEARRQLGGSAQKIQIVFVSTDPDRDTPTAMAEFIDRFDSSIVGVTGTKAELEPVWASYGVTVEDGGETHSTYIYLIDPEGKLRLTYAYPVPSINITADLKTLLRNN
jgi:protein SCO1